MYSKFGDAGNYFDMSIFLLKNQKVIDKKTCRLETN